MVSTFIPGETPCFECVFGNIDHQHTMPGVIGPAPGVVASLQALEVIKIILGIGTLLTGRLLFFSGRDMAFREIMIEKNPHCRVCTT
jgi:adenylyltransferase/sulfurtransferase